MNDSLVVVPVRFPLTRHSRATLERAIEALHAGDDERALDALRGPFTTGCEREDPALAETAAGHDAACHLHGQGTGGWAERRDLGASAPQD